MCFRKWKYFFELHLYVNYQGPVAQKLRILIKKMSLIDILAIVDVSFSFVVENKHISNLTYFVFFFVQSVS